MFVPAKCVWGSINGISLVCGKVGIEALIRIFPRTLWGDQRRTKEGSIKMVKSGGKYLKSHVKREKRLEKKNKTKKNRR